MVAVPHEKIVNLLATSVGEVRLWFFYFYNVRKELMINYTKVGTVIIFYKVRYRFCTFNRHQG